MRRDRGSNSSVAKKESKTVPVKLNLSDYLEENFEISEIEMDQNQMRINGSSLQLKEIDTLYTEEISLKDYDVPQWTKLPNGLDLWQNQIRPTPRRMNDLLHQMIDW